MSNAPVRSAPDEAAQAGRGVLYIAFAKLYFMVAGAVIEFRLPAILANTVFGAYAVVASTVSPLNNVLVTGTIQAVSRFTAQQPGASRAIQAAGLRMHLRIGLPVAAAFVAMAPLLAWFFHDRSKTGPLMLAGAIVAGYSFYAVMVGTANGRREFHKQAGLDICFASLRALGILGLAAAGFGLYGAIGGWVGAVAVILVVASVLVGLPRQAERHPVGPLAWFFGSVAVYLVLLNLIMSVDQLLLKRLGAEWFAAHADALAAVGQDGPGALAGALAGTLTDRLPGLAGASSDGAGMTAAAAADVQVGYYRAVQNLARLSYQAIIAGMFVIFPLVSRSTFDSDREATRRYIHTTMRYSLIFATAIGVVMAANPRPMLDVVYPADYAQVGAPALVALALGNVAFCLFAIAGTILNGAGQTRQAILVAGATLAVAAVANAVVIPAMDPGPDMLLGAASATALAMLVGAGLGGWVLVRRLGAFMPWSTLLRVPVAVAAAVAVGSVMPATAPLATLGEAAVVGLSFFAALVLTGELGRRDLSALAALGGRRRRKGGD